MGSSVKAGKIMSYCGIETLEAVSFGFGDSVFILGQEFTVSTVSVRTVFATVYFGDSVDELFPRPIITISAFEVDGSFSLPIISDPDPKLFRFF